MMDKEPANPRRKRKRTLSFEALIVVAIVITVAAIFLPGVAKMRDDRPRAVSAANLKQIGLAMHTYNDSEGHLPGANAPYPDPKGSGKSYPVSWRVLLLNYFESTDLQWDYHFDEPWDGPRNILLLNRMPKVYRHPKADPSIVPRGHTHYRVFISPPSAKPSALFTDGVPGPKLTQIADGTSYTIIVVEAAEAVPWTMPEGLLYDPTQPLPKLGGLVPGITQAVMVNTAGHSFRTDFSEDKLRAWITKDGGEPVDEEK